MYTIKPRPQLVDDDNILPRKREVKRYQRWVRNHNWFPGLFTPGTGTGRKLPDGTGKRYDVLQTPRLSTDVTEKIWYDVHGSLGLTGRV